MSKKKEKPQVIPIIKGIKPANGEKRIIALHNHPEQIKFALKTLKEEAKDEQQVLDLFTDIEVLVHWALARLPLVPPPTEKPASGGEPADTGSEKGQ